MQEHIYNGFVDEIEKISTFIRVSKGGKRYGKERPKPESGYSTSSSRSLFDWPGAEQNAAEFAEMKRLRGKGRPVRFSREMGVSGKKELPSKKKKKD